MSETKEYSTDLWDYLGDMPYMPSRHDRDQLVEKKRFQEDPNLGLLFSC